MHWAVNSLKAGSVSSASSFPNPIPGYCAGDEPSVTQTVNGKARR